MEPVIGESIITIYKTGVDTQVLFSKLGIPLTNAKMIDATTLRLNQNEIEILQNNASYLIAMNVVDFSEFLEDEIYTYQLPVPKDQDGHPYFARATLVYFPKSDRNQGVDYTSTEMDIHFECLQEKNGKASIKSIDKNKQADDGLHILYKENKNVNAI